ncbi:MAG TPA: MCP four helix bundle domain-containing protein, partial [Gallionella sp.]
MTTRNKLFLGFGLMIAFLAIVIATAYRGIATIQASQHSLYQKEFANTVDLMTMRSDENGVRAALLEMLVATTRADQESWHQDIKERSKEISVTTQRLLERNRNDSSLLTQLEELDKIREAFAQTRDNQLIPLIYAGKKEQAKTLGQGVQLKRYNKMRDIASALCDSASEKARAAVAESELVAERTIYQFAMVGGLAILLAVAMALLIS